MKLTKTEIAEKRNKLCEILTKAEAEAPDPHGQVGPPSRPSRSTEFHQFQARPFHRPHVADGGRA